jgi:excisionase family DNA binding protein
MGQETVKFSPITRCGKTWAAPAIPDPLTWIADPEPSSIVIAGPKNATSRAFTTTVERQRRSNDLGSLRLALRSKASTASSTTSARSLRQSSNRTTERDIVVAFTTTTGARTMNEKVQLLTVRQAADLLQLSAPFVYGLINRGQLPAVRLGRAVRVPKQALETMMAKGGVMRGGVR